LINSSANTNKAPAAVNSLVVLDPATAATNLTPSQQQQLTPRPKRQLDLHRKTSKTPATATTVDLGQLGQDSPITISSADDAQVGM
jgi:hypothetical protein